MRCQTAYVFLILNKEHTAIGRMSIHGDKDRPALFILGGQL